jgi:hypothetical protein
LRNHFNLLPQWADAGVRTGFRSLPSAHRNASVFL